jgi:hypothetical protein
LFAPQRRNQGFLSRRFGLLASAVHTFLLGIPLRTESTSWILSSHPFGYCRIY